MLFKQTYVDMSRAAKTLLAFAVYVVLLGVALLVAPATVIRILRLPEIATGWARVVGLLALVIGVYDFVAARADVLPYIRASVYVRIGFAVGIALLVVSGEMPVAALPIGAIDLGGALWTAWAMRGAR